MRFEINWPQLEKPGFRFKVSVEKCPKPNIQSAGLQMECVGSFDEGKWHKRFQALIEQKFCHTWVMAVNDAPRQSWQGIQSHQPLNLVPGCVRGWGGCRKRPPESFSSVARKLEDEAPATHNMNTNSFRKLIFSHFSSRLVVGNLRILNPWNIWAKISTTCFTVQTFHLHVKPTRKGFEKKQTKSQIGAKLQNRESFGRPPLVSQDMPRPTLEAHNVNKICWRHQKLAPFSNLYLVNRKCPAFWSGLALLWHSLFEPRDMLLRLKSLRKVGERLEGKADIIGTNYRE